MRKICGLFLLLFGVGTPANAETPEQIQAACERLYYEFATAADGNDPEAVAALFTADARFDHGGDISIGQAAIREYMAKIVARRKGAQTMHVASNVKISPINANTATGTAYIIMYATGPNAAPPAALRGIAIYRDHFSRTADGWRFSERIMKQVPSPGSAR